VVVALASSCDGGGSGGTTEVEASFNGGGGGGGGTVEVEASFNGGGGGGLTMDPVTRDPP
jgi:hypothetical protein